MKIEDELFFSPKVRFRDLDLDDCESTIASLKDRICGFYVDPSILLGDAGSQFASGLLACAAIDFVGRLSFAITRSAGGGRSNPRGGWIGEESGDVAVVESDRAHHEDTVLPDRWQATSIVACEI